MIMIPPQTPRTKTRTKLTLDTTYSNLGSPSSPSSPCYSPMASPTLSGSWNMNSNKSHAELTASLKEAYNLVKEKERDLTLAAEIGKSLLENNIALKAKYEEIVLELQQLQLQRHQQKRTTFIALHAEKPNVAPIAPPNNYFDDNERDYSDTESHTSHNSSYEPRLQSEQLKNRNKKNDQSISYKDLENIRELEGQNQLLQSRLDELLKEYNDSDKSNKTKIRKLETDLSHYQEVCLSATHQIEVLEQENERLLQKQRTDFRNNQNNKKASSDDENLIENLMNKVCELESQNNTVERAKTEIEKRLQRVVRDLESLQEEYDELSEKSRDFEILKVAHHEQELLINELNESLEEQRAMIVGMRSNAYSRSASRSNSFSFSDNGMMSNALRRISNPPPNQISQQGLGGKIKTTLLSELENVWFRELSLFPKDTPITSEKNLADIFNGSQPDDDISQLGYLSDDDFSFLDEFEEDDELAMRKREWFWKRWARFVLSCFRLIWRWCRFIIILFCAVIMALYRGPDDILPSDM